ncbi:MAG: energy transducer TonB [Povalibacter sp.]
MNAWHKFLATTPLLLSFAAFAGTPSACDVHAVDSATKFPMRSQLRGQEGIVYLNVKIDEKGRVSSTELQRSSGYRLLDEAAQHSALKDWVFDVSQCQRKDLPADRVIAVEYRNEEYR